MKASPPTDHHRPPTVATITAMAGGRQGQINSTVINYMAAKRAKKCSKATQHSAVNHARI